MTHPRRWVVGAIAVGAAIVAILVLTAGTGSDGGRGGQLDRLTSARNFRAAPDAAGALATIADRLVGDSRECIAEHGRGDPRCEALGVAAAWAQVSAVEVPHCTRPALEAARADLLDLLDALAEVEAGRRATPPDVPPIPECD